MIFYSQLAHEPTYDLGIGLNPLGEFSSAQAAARAVLDNLPPERTQYNITICWLVGHTPHAVEFRATRTGWSLESADPDADLTI